MQSLEISLSVSLKQSYFDFIVQDFALKKRTSTRPSELEIFLFLLPGASLDHRPVPYSYHPNIQWKEGFHGFMLPDFFFHQ